MEHAIIQSSKQLVKTEALRFYVFYFHHYFSLFDLFQRQKVCIAALKSYLLYFQLSQHCLFIDNSWLFFDIKTTIYIQILKIKK